MRTPGDHTQLTGRFAPSPTGPLHMGSLLTALASFLDIRQRGGQWFVRLDDLDPPRQDPDANAQIIASLSAHGLIGNRNDSAEIDYQSTHEDRYVRALKRIQADLFYCHCSRRSLAGQKIYPGTCRYRTTWQADCAVRLQVEPGELSFRDEVKGAFVYQMAIDQGDFIVKRRDGLWAYNFAAAVDDGEDATHVMRGEDLLPVTAQQIYVMQRLKLAPPQYAHLPVLCYPDGTKLSKQTHAPALDNNRATANLRTALSYLGQNPPAEPSWSVSQWLTWGLSNWRLERVPAELKKYTQDA
ncbi:MAG: tRNA glutamyl-Q(34) synthetase GluQRS [bacterium]